MCTVSLAHVGVGCNRNVHALHWGESGVIAYAAHSSVVVYDPQEARVVATLLGHSGAVGCVRWLPSAHFGLAAPREASVLASGAADGAVCIWLWQPRVAGQPWQLLARLEAHAAPVTSLTSLALGGGQLTLVSTAGDSQAAVWVCAAANTPQAALQGAWRLRQHIALGHQLQHCAALAHLPLDPGWLLLALGGVDERVRLLACPPGGEFTQVCSLSGHQDWIMGLSFAQMDDGRLLLASASQDKNVRVWAITLDNSSSSSSTATAAGPGTPGGDSGPTQLASLLTRYAPRPHINTDLHTYSAVLEALLVGHEDWVNSVAWQPPQVQPGSSSMHQPACLLTASMDRTMMVWRPDAATGLWMCEESVGDAGVNHLGYYTGFYAPGGDAIAAHGFTGALHIWRRREGRWEPQHALGGHFNAVVDACWAADGACLVTVSEDQTARLTACMQGGHWCEIARPQVHGHDFSCVAALPSPLLGGRHLYASGSEEKVVRVFEAPQAFLDTLAMARGKAAPALQAASGGGRAAPVLGAALPALGLSNKAVYAGDAAATAAAAASSSGEFHFPEGPDSLPYAAPSAVAGPPLEEHLAQNTLWPEIHKLYGHGNELYCLAADPKGQYLASACRAQGADTAAIWIWDTAKWTGVASLPAHTLTVTQLAFAPDGQMLASCSRDRTVTLFARCDTSSSSDSGASVAASSSGGTGVSPPFRLVGRLKAHARIVWGLDWSPDSRLLATASRDGTVKLWAMPLAPTASSSSAAELPTAPLAVLQLGNSVRAVAFAPDCAPGSSYHLAVGLEDGSLQLLALALRTSSGDAAAAGAPQQLELACEPEAVWQSSQYTQHGAAIRRLCWRRQEGSSSGFHLASCSDDHALRIFSIEL